MAYTSPFDIQDDDPEFQAFKKQFLGVGDQPNAPGFVTGIKQGLGGFTSGIGRVAEDLGWKNNPIKSYGDEVQANNPSSAASQSWEGFKESPWQGIKEFAGQGIGSTLPYLAAFALPGGQGAAATGLARVGMVARGLPMQTALAAAPIYGQVREDQQKQGFDDIPSAAAAAIGGGIVESKLGIQRVLGKNTEAPLKSFVNELASSPLKTGLKTWGRTGLEEGAEEILQQPMQQLGAHRNPLTEESLRDTAWSGFGGLIGGLAMGGLGGAKMGLAHKRIDDFRQQDLLNPNTPLNVLDDQAKWNQAFIERDQGVPAGEHFYNQRQGEIDQYIEGLVPQMQEQQRLENAHRIFDVLNTNGGFTAEGQGADILNETFGIGQKPVKQQYARAYNEPLETPVVVSDNSGNPITLSTVGEAYDYRHGVGKFAPQAAKVDALGYPLSPYQPVEATQPSSTTPSWSRFGVEPTQGDSNVQPTQVAQGSNQAASGNSSGSAGNTPDQPGVGRGGDNAAGAPVGRSGANQPVGNTSGGVGAVNSLVNATPVGDSQVLVNAGGKKISRNSSTYLQHAVDSLYEKGSENHVDLSNLIAEAGGYKNALKKLITHSMDGLKIALSSASEKDSAIVRAALGWDNENHQVAETRPTLDEIGKQFGYKPNKDGRYAAGPEAVLKKFGITNAVLDKMWVSNLQSVSAAELLPTQGADGEVANFGDAGFSTSDSIAATHVNEHASAKMSDEERAIAQRNVADTKAADEAMLNGLVEEDHRKLAKMESERLAIAEQSRKADKYVEANRKRGAEAGMRELIRDAANSPHLEAAKADWDELKGSGDPEFGNLHPRDAVSWIIRYGSIVDKHDGSFDELWTKLANAQHDAIRVLEKHDGRTGIEAEESRQLTGSSELAEESGSGAEEVRQLENKATNQAEDARTEEGLTPQDISAAWNTLAEENNLPKFAELLDDQRQALLEAYDEDSLQSAVNVVAQEVQDETGSSNFVDVVPSRGGQRIHMIRDTDGNDIAYVKLRLEPNHPLVSIVKSAMQSETGHLFNHINNIYVTNDTSDDAMVIARDGKYDLVFTQSVLDSNPEYLKLTVSHELGHIADDVSGKKIYSSAEHFDAVVGYVRQVWNRLPSSSLLKMQLFYPLGDGTKAINVNREVFAQLWAAVQYQPLRAELARYMPKALEYINEAYQHQVSIGKASSGVEQGREGTQSEEGGDRARQVSAGIQRIPSQQGERFKAVISSGQYRQASTLVKQTLEYLGNKFQSLENNLMFGHQLAEKAARLMPGTANYFKSVQNRQTERVKHEQEIARIANLFNELEIKQQTALNAFVQKSTMEGKWGFKPTWFEKDVQTTVDPTMKTEFDALAPEAQQIVKDMFKFGSEQQKRFDESVNANIDDPKKKVQRNQMYGKPYSPLKRFGDHVVVGKSAAFVTEEQTNPGSKRLAEMKADPKHYYVEFTDGNWEAIKLRDEMAATNTGLTWVSKPLQLEDGDLVGMNFTMLEKLKKQIEASDSKSSNATKGALKSLANQLYIQQLNQMHANKSQAQRLNVKGADTDMMRAFVSQGRAEAALIANLRTHAETESALQQIQKAAREGDNQDAKTRIANAVLRRHLAMLNFKPTPWQNMLMGLNSSMMLLTSPAYYLTNATQPFVVSLPYMAGRFGGANSWNTLRSAYGTTLELVKLSTLFKNQNLDAAHLKKFDSVGREADALKVLLDENLVNIGMEMELGDIANQSKNPAWKNVQKGMQVLKTGVANVEVLNRLSTAVAGYRLAYTEALNKKLSAEDAHNAGVEYARKLVIDTHGDYAGYNAPTVMMQGAFGNLPVKLMTQFKKFQFIQAGLLIGTFRDAYLRGNLNPTEKAAAKAMFKWMLGTQAALAGALGGVTGVPMALLGSILAGAFGDDGEDKEAFLRRILGGGAFAQLILHGAPAAAGVDVSKRVGMGAALDPFRMADPQTDWSDYALSLAGPSAGLASRAGSGMSYISKGQYWKGLEMLMPSGVITNASKLARYESEGLTNSRGDVVMKPEEVSLMTDLMQGLGLETTQLSDRRWKAEAIYDRGVHFKEKTSKLQREYVEAFKDGDQASLAEVRQEWLKLQAERVKQGFKRENMTTLTRAPMEQQKRERNTIHGLQSTQTNKKFVESIDSL